MVHDFIVEMEVQRLEASGGGGGGSRRISRSRRLTAGLSEVTSFLQKELAGIKLASWGLEGCDSD